MRLLLVGSVLGLTMAAAVTQPVLADTSTFTSTPNLGIPDDGYMGTLASMASDTINASALPVGHVVTDITVEMAINHSWIGDLTVKLRSPDQTVLTILNRPASTAPDDGTDSPPGGDNANLTTSFPVSFNDAYAVSAESMGSIVGNDFNVCEHDFECQFSPAPDTAVSPSSFASAFKGEQAMSAFIYRLSRILP